MISDKELFKQMADRDVVNLYRYLIYNLAGGTSIASLLLNYSEKSYKLNLDNTSENKKVISILNEINENEKTIISLLKCIVEGDKH